MSQHLGEETLVAMLHGSSEASEVRKALRLALEAES